MKFTFNLKNSYSYIYLILSLIVSFWIISIFEIVARSSNAVSFFSTAVSLCYKLLNDFWTGSIIGLLFSPLYLGSIYIKKPVGEVVIKILFSLLILAQFSLVKYSLTTLINLGADILGYSMEDIYITVTASESLSFLYFVPYFMLPMLYLGINKVSVKYIGNRQIYIASAALLIIFGSLKLFTPEMSEALHQNKIYFFTKDIIRFENEKKVSNAANLFYQKEYPLVQPFKSSKDVLSPFFEIQEEKPNIVLIIVEGLGAEFIGNNALRGFTPFLDSLIPKSLYWENFVSNTGRTFGVIPSLLGSLPYGEKGFLEINPLPSHVSLISILKANGYTTSYFSGDESSFDRKINFLEYNKVDNVVDVNNFGKGYVKTKENSGGFSWGYPDAEIFRKTLADLDEKKQPRLDIIMTLTNHEPFDFPSKNVYLKKVDRIIDSNKNLGVSADQIRMNKDIYSCLLYTDNSIKDFMEAYSKRPEYKNTIFIITGDHRLIPISQKNKLARFHVPLFIFSPMLKKAERFKSISSHWDITPSLVSFLMNNYTFDKIKKTTWMSQGLDTARQFRNIHQIPLMRSKGSVNDFIYKEYLYSDGEVFKIDENFELNEIDDESILQTITDSLRESKRLNAYLTKKNKIIPNALNIYTRPAFEFSKEELLTINKLTKGLILDDCFLVARQLAFNKERKKARLLCNYILNELPNYGDVRTLKARTLAWDGDYAKAETELLDVVKRTPYYEDSYVALMDVYWWSGQNSKAIAIAKLALKNEVKTPELSVKLAQAYKRMNAIPKAEKIMDSIIKKYPKNTEYPKIKKSFKE
jgi:lipoteichoic acid synthase